MPFFLVHSFPLHLFILCFFTFCLISSFMLYQELMTHFSGSEIYFVYLNSASLIPWFISIFSVPYRSISLSHPSWKHISELPALLLSFFDICPSVFSSAVSDIFNPSAVCYQIFFFFFPPLSRNRVESEFESIRKSVRKFCILVFIFMSNVASP